jgi:hypothetical protein
LAICSSEVRGVLTGSSEVVEVDGSGVPATIEEAAEEIEERLDEAGDALQNWCQRRTH